MCVCMCYMNTHTLSYVPQRKLNAADTPVSVSTIIIHDLVSKYHSQENKNKQNHPEQKQNKSSLVK